MGLPLFYIEEKNIDARRGMVVLTGKHAHHLSKSLRVKKGDRVSLADSKGNVFKSKVISLDTTSVYLVVESRAFFEKERPRIVLYQSALNRFSMDEVISRAAESGVDRVIPFLSERSVIRRKDAIIDKVERMRRVAVESSMTARRPWVLEIDAPYTLKEVLKNTEEGLDIVLWEKEEKHSLSDILPEESPPVIRIYAGPEGGFSENDIAGFSSRGFKFASLGNLNLRAISAGSYASMLIRYHYGSLNTLWGDRPIGGENI